MSDILKVNYDDFYKFLVSGGVILVVLWSLLATYFAVYINLFGVIFYLILDGLTGYMIGWAAKKWYENQKKIDKKLEFEIAIMETQKKLWDLNYQHTLRNSNRELDKSVPLADTKHEGEAV